MAEAVARENEAGSEMRKKLADDEKSDMIPKVPLKSWIEGAGSNSGRAKRITDTVSHFEKKFGTTPSFYVRVPGRVNLIGEHVDYCGYGVFPMAIQQDMFICGRIVPPSELGSTLHLVNTCEKFNDFQCSLDDIGTILSKRQPGVAPQWHLYFLCGVQGVLERSTSRTSIEICIDGKVPPSAGLSSSSALVCAAALATLVALGETMSKKELAETCAKSERYIGTEGGGMDQAIACMATEGCAQMIEFVPKLNGTNIRLPGRAVFVIANTLVDSNKAASDGYNIRVAECRLGCWILAKKQGLADIFKFNRFKDLQLALQLTLQSMLSLIINELHEGSYTAEEIASLLGIPMAGLLEQPLLKKIPFTTSQLKIRQRAQHVLEEATRVEEFRKICEDEAGDPNVLFKLGYLMSASHKSLKELYDCSHPHLDRIIDISDEISYGARLTGAGWGGCMVALLDEDQLPNYLFALQTQFYEPVHQITDIGEHVFVTSPGAGALILE